MPRRPRQRPSAGAGAVPPAHEDLWCSATSRRPAPEGFPAVDLAAHYAGAPCLGCHEPHRVEALVPPFISHSLDDLPACVTCHVPTASSPCPSGTRKPPTPSASPATWCTHQRERPMSETGMTGPPTRPRRRALPPARPEGRARRHPGAVWVSLLGVAVGAPASRRGPPSPPASARLRSVGPRLGLRHRHHDVHRVRPLRGGLQAREQHPEEPEINRTWSSSTSSRRTARSRSPRPRAGVRASPPTRSRRRPTCATPTSSPGPACSARTRPAPGLSVSATFRMEDGVVFVDENRCIGCGYCIVACPYGARYIVPASGQTPKGVAGVVDKCTFCYHASRGACSRPARSLPANARIFGDLNDPPAR